MGDADCGGALCLPPRGEAAVRTSLRDDFCITYLSVNFVVITTNKKYRRTFVRLYFYPIYRC